MFMDRIIQFGFHLGVGVTDLPGGTHGDQLYIMTIILTGDLITDTIHLVIQ